MKTSQDTLFVIDDDADSRGRGGIGGFDENQVRDVRLSAEGFLERFDPSLTGCALVDFRLGDMNGLQLQARLKALDSLLCVIMISAYADVSVITRALKNGAVAFIEKPYRSDELAEAIRNALGRSACVR